MFFIIMLSHWKEKICKDLFLIFKKRSWDNTIVTVFPLTHIFQKSQTIFKLLISFFLIIFSLFLLGYSCYVIFVLGFNICRSIHPFNLACVSWVLSIRCFTRNMEYHDRWVGLFFLSALTLFLVFSPWYNTFIFAMFYLEINISVMFFDYQIHYQFYYGTTIIDNLFLQNTLVNWTRETEIEK
jgi:hypothetical protein